MQFDMAAEPYIVSYKIMNSTITPRPIAWVTTVSADGQLNCAPHSFFNAMGYDPPLIALGLIKNPKTGGDKDTAANILATGEFTIGLVAEADAERMNLTSVDAPSDVNELDLAGIETLPSSRIRPPIIASSPVSFECRRVAALDIGKGQTIFVGEVLVTHIADEFVIDRDRLHLDTPGMRLVARMHGAGWYLKSTDLFEMPRPSYAKIAGTGTATK